MPKITLTLLKLTSILLILAFGLQTFQKGLILTDYSVNRAAYEKNCVNKARPQMKCHGKCQMMKKMQQEEKKDQQSQEKKADNSFDQYCNAGVYVSPVTAYPLLTANRPVAYLSGKPVKMARTLLRPPAC